MTTQNQMTEGTTFQNRHGDLMIVKAKNADGLDQVNFFPTSVHADFVPANVFGGLVAGLTTVCVYCGGHFVFDGMEDVIRIGITEDGEDWTEARPFCRACYDARGYGFSEDTMAAEAEREAMDRADAMGEGAWN